MRTTSRRAGIGLLIVVLISGGCSEVIVTRRVVEGTVSEGVTYFLPKRLHQVTVKMTLVQVNEESVKKARDEVVKTAIVLKALQSKIAELEPQVASLKATAEAIAAVPPGTPSSPALPDAVKKFDATSGELEGARILARVAASDYEHALIRVGELERELAAREGVSGEEVASCRYDSVIKVVPLKLVPDDRYPFVAKLNHNPFYDDKLVLRTTPEGLLTGATGESTDRTGDVLVTIAQTVAMFMTGVPVGGVGSFQMPAFKATRDRKKDGDGDKEPASCPPGGTIERIVDLASTREHVSINAFLREYGLRMDKLTRNLVELEERPCDPECAAATMSDARRGHVRERKKPPLTTAAGLLYRRDLPYQLTFSRCQPPATGGSCDDKDPTWAPISSQMVFLPQRSPIAQIGFKGGGLVTSNADLAFSDGMLTTMDTKRPSEVLSVVKLPLNVVRGMTSVITEIISLKVDYATKDAAYATQLYNMTKALDDLAKLSAPKAPATPPTTTEPGPGAP
jgi:hypothetical protein